MELPKNIIKIFQTGQKVIESVLLH
jgi:hypothetical protein